MPIFTIIPLIIVILIIRYSIRHWEKETWYFRLAKVFSVVAFGVSFMAYWIWTTANLSQSPLAGLGYLCLLIFPSLIALATWCIVWLLGFLLDVFVIKKNIPKPRKYDPSIEEDK